MSQFDLAVLIIRVSLGFSIALHGLNKAKSIPGTSSWFSSIGMKWPKQQAILASTTEITAGALMTAGLLTAVSCIAVIALMTVAIITVHAKVGYFIFLPNGGWEYCASIIAVAGSLALLGPGKWSLDHLFDLNQSLAPVALPVGIMCAVCQLLLCWRPPSADRTS
ncbi:MAG: DoxX family protein [Actinomycetota bacterium]